MVQKSNLHKIAELFFQKPSREWYLKEISRKTKIAHTSVINYLNKLITEGIITKKQIKRGKRNFPYYKANLNSPRYKPQKIIYNFSSIINSEIINYLNGKLMPQSIVVFGSYQKGEDTEDSDIDIFVEANEEKINLEKFEKLLNRKIQLHFNPNFKTYSKELKNNIANGWVFGGYLKYENTD